MSVRAKFKVQKIETHLWNKLIDGKWQDVEMRTIVLYPVHSTDPASENKTFWDATPSGEFRLGTVNPSAWERFQIGGEYYIDFTEAT